MMNLEATVPHSGFNYTILRIDFTKEHGSSVGTVTRLRYAAGKGFFSPRHLVQTGSGAQRSSYPMGIGSSFPAVKLPEREAEHLPLSSAKVTSSLRRTYLSTETALPLRELCLDFEISDNTY